ncbi:alpha/beta fold hydrolase [Paraburkholderia diazotrophica]|uniref:Pimeloyl-ACP methyl ester carboxylesterase n=1 Tax=Paraburkholderia diazotrophica TaxID=667676 RepID=A0A1H7DE46_9BURK|nr:alpha/beta hydrolase [Paraburkholderia diazotrophica]SEJ97822.1 Pimeloyl-ACP methyl ester carboxylesterase [Paraburkholderia diazotrophica]
MSTRPPVVFIHGFFGPLNATEFAEDDAVKRSSRRVLAPDLLGYGEYQHVPFDAITLRAQAEHISRSIEQQFGDETVDVVGHSVGGAISMLLAHAHPERVRRIVNIEGNFTLDDAFWSASVGRMSDADATALLERLRADPLEWLRGAGVDATPDMRDAAAHSLARQPASTLRAMGQSVVATTGDKLYLSIVRKVFGTHPVHLIAGEHSRDGWHAPDWASIECASFQTIEGAGHMMMLERPHAFAAALRYCLD